MTIQEKLEAGPLFDNAIVGHGFTPYNRDYDVLVDVVSSKPVGSGSYIAGRWRYRFTHCVSAQFETVVSDPIWKKSWADLFTDLETWRQSDEPEGFIWGTNWSNAYPGLFYIENSEVAQDWALRLEYPMHEVNLETNCFLLTLIFHDVVIEQIAQGNPETNELTPLA